MTQADWVKERAEAGVKYLANKELRDVLMKKYGGKCFWCKCEVKEYPEIFNRNLRRREHYPDDSATIDHLNDGVRGFKPLDPTGRYKVLACYKCNQERSKMLSMFINKMVNERLDKAITLAQQRTEKKWRAKVEKLMEDHAGWGSETKYGYGYNDGFHQALTDLLEE